MNQFQGQYPNPGMNLPPSQNNGPVPQSYQGDNNHQQSLSASFGQMNLQGQQPQNSIPSPPQMNQFNQNVPFTNNQPDFNNKQMSGQQLNKPPTMFQGMPPSNSPFSNPSQVPFKGFQNSGNNMDFNEQKPPFGGNQLPTGQEMQNYNNQIQQNLNNGPPILTNNPPSNAKPVFPIQPKFGNMPMMPPGIQQQNLGPNQPPGNLNMNTQDNAPPMGMHETSFGGQQQSEGLSQMGMAGQFGGKPPSMPPMEGQNSISGPPSTIQSGIPGQQRLSGPPTTINQGIPGPVPTGLPGTSGEPQMGQQGSLQMGMPGGSQMLQQGPPQMGVPGGSQMSQAGPPSMGMPNQPPMGPPGGPQMGMPNQPPMGAPGGPQIGMSNQPQMGPPGGPQMGMPNQPPMGAPGGLQMGMPNQSPMGPPGGPQMGMQSQPPMGMPGQPPMGMPGQPPMGMSGGPQMGIPGGAQMGMPGQQLMGMPGPPGMMDSMQQKQQRLDPEQMPSAVQVREDDKIAKTGPFPTGYPTAELPPLVTTDYIAQDQGNSSPRFIRSTIYAVPQTNDMLKVSHVPFVVSCTPFAKPMSNEYIPPIVNLGELGPVRCQRCKAYMCPFMQFIDGGRKFKCPFCEASTPVVDEYFAHLDHTGRRTDIAHRPEFCLGSYEFVATTSYCKNKVLPKEPAFIFMLDVSYNAIKSGLVRTFCSNLKNFLSMLPKESYQEKSTLRVGLVTYDHTLHFYNLSSKAKKTEMTIVSDLEDVFVPFVDGFLVDASEAEESIQKVLDEIPKLFGNTKITDTCLGPVVQAGLDALKSSDRSGKIFVFHTSLPTLEAPGKLVNREDRKVLGGEKEKAVLSPNGDFYTKLGEECTKNGVCVDLFLFPNAFIDVASMAPLVSISGGHLYKYQYFDASKDSENFLIDFKNAISRETAFDAIMRIRTSTGLRATTFYGHFLMQNSTDMEFGAIDSNKQVMAEIKYDDKLPPNEPCYIQAAILYTSCSGQRRLRIHNLSLTTTIDFSIIYKAIEADTFVAYLYKNAERIVKEKIPKDMKEQTINLCAHVLATYRDKCSDNPPIGQLILPECLRLLPLYLGSIIKNDGLAGGADLTVDNRAWLMQLIPGMRTEEIMRILYPRIIPVTGVSVENDNDEFFMPSEIRASYEYLKKEEAYLIENGVNIFLWIGQQVSNEWIQAIFNVPNIQQVDNETHTIPERDNPQSRGLRKVAKIITNEILRHTKITIIRQTDPLEAWMKRFLVEDRYAGQGGSYVDSLCTLHREIRSILS
ncbi:Sec24CD ortholog [Strongyloides ratti]|uniref:Sec24CD ortholog n=1 Tax=Strongyloides ratti TaxID=34506 RepID=A0A090LRF5_STRRB|nr:Sec24CD ortholog [Strongyloides ratti]CEF70722.1 Sec24CD ortholog [Strongyloides ratti]